MVVAEKPKIVLDPVRHARLIEDLDHMCAIANVPKRFVRESMTSVCDSTEVDWVANYRLYRDSYPGLLIASKDRTEERCMAIAGALMRNFIDARVITLSTLTDAMDKGDAPAPTVLVIPNLFMQSYGKTLPAWKIASIYDLLISRWTANKPTVIGIENLDSLQQSYGMAFAQHLKNYKA